MTSSNEQLVPVEQIDRGDAALRRIADRIERWAYEAIAETARAYSYIPGSNRYYGARKKAETAEGKLDKAIAALRAKAGQP